MQTKARADGCRGCRPGRGMKFKQTPLAHRLRHGGPGRPSRGTSVAFSPGGDTASAVARSIRTPPVRAFRAYTFRACRPTRMASSSAWEFSATAAQHPPRTVHAPARSYRERSPRRGLTALRVHNPHHARGHNQSDPPLDRFRPGRAWLIVSLRVHVASILHRPVLSERSSVFGKPSPLSIARKRATRQQSHSGLAPRSAKMGNLRRLYR